MTGHQGHAHTSTGTSAGTHRSRLRVVLAIGVTVLLAEVAGAWWSGSLALLADAAHLAADVGGIAFALLAVSVAQRAPTERRTYGYQRIEILAAVVNAVILFAVGGYIVYEAVNRLFSPAEPHSGIVIALGALATAGAGVSVWLLREPGRESLNMRGAFMEALADLLGSAAVIVSGVVVALTGFEHADSIAAVLIGALIVPRTWTLLTAALHILMEAVPEHLDLAEVRTHIMNVPGVIDVHDLHAWTITSGQPMLSAHVVVEDAEVVAGRAADVLDLLQECLDADFEVVHTTFQIEPRAHAEHEVGGHA